MHMLPSRVRKHVDPQVTVKISEDSHNFILDEIFRREALDYDPTMVIVLVAKLRMRRRNFE